MRTETTTEWGVRLSGAPDVWLAKSHYYDPESCILDATSASHAAALAAAPRSRGAVVSRQRTVTLTDWTEAPS